MLYDNDATSTERITNDIAGEMQANRRQGVPAGFQYEYSFKEVGKYCEGEWSAKAAEKRHDSWTTIPV